MAKNKKRLNFGPGYQYDDSKSHEENVKAMKAYYAKRGEIVKDLTPEEKSENKRILEEMRPEIERMLDEK
jgi:hypothetical protein